MRGNKENYRYTECGLNSVVLVGITVFHCTCGVIVPEIPAIGWIHELLMFRLFKKKTLLLGDEIRFLRKMVGLSATKLAKQMSVSKEAISRWENDKHAIGAESDRLLRFVCMFEFLRQNSIVEGQEVAQVLERVKQITSMTLPDVLEKASSRSEQMNIDPEMLSQFGSGGDPNPAPTVQ